MLAITDADKRIAEEVLKYSDKVCSNAPLRRERVGDAIKNCTRSLKLSVKSSASVRGWSTKVQQILSL